MFLNWKYLFVYWTNLTGEIITVIACFQLMIVCTKSRSFILFHTWCATDPSLVIWAPDPPVIFCHLENSSSLTNTNLTPRRSLGHFPGLKFALLELAEFLTQTPLSIESVFVALEPRSHVSDLHCVLNLCDKSRAGWEKFTGNFPGRWKLKLLYWKWGTKIILPASKKVVLKMLICCCFEAIMVSKNWV